MSQQTIIIVEDEPDILEVIEYNLAREGYRILSARDGQLGLELVQRERPDLLVLDLMLPGLSGMEVCRRLKSAPATRAIPIVMVTAKAEESDIVLGLGLGADDYIRKPFSPRELIARIQAVLRRGPLKGEQPEQRIVRDGVSIDGARHQVSVDGALVTFTATEFRLLHFLCAHPGHVYTREQLVTNAIGTDVIVIDRNIDVHIRSIRKKLGARRELIETVRGVGYRVREEDAGARESSTSP